MEMYAGILLTAASLAALFGQGLSQCTFHSAFASSSWHDNTKGTLTFAATTMSGWGFKSVRTTGSTTINRWQCVNSSSDAYLVMRTRSPFSIMTGSGTTNVYAYLCMQLTNITDVSYYYYQKQVQQLNLGGERLKVSGSATLTQADVCDDVVTVPTTEFHVLVKSGSESQAAIQCPDSLLFSADYVFYGSDGTTQCQNGNDVWDLCSNKSEMTFDYNTCSQQIIFSQGGKLWCIFSLYSGYVFTVVYNQDTTITSGLSRFACLSVDDNYASVAPGNCTATQTPFDFPKEADGTTSIGHRLVIGEHHVDCGPGTGNGLEGWEIALIVLAVLYVVFTTMAVIFIILFIYAALMFLIIMLYLAGLTDFTPSERLMLPPLNLSKIDKTDTKTAKDVPSIVVTTPTDIHVRDGGRKDVKNGGPKRPLEKKTLKTSDSGLKPATSNPNLPVHTKSSPRNNNQPHSSRT